MDVGDCPDPSTAGGRSDWCLDLVMGRPAPAVPAPGVSPGIAGVCPVRQALDAFTRKSQSAEQRSAESAHALRFAGDRYADVSVVRPGRGRDAERRFERDVIPSKRRRCMSDRVASIARLPTLQREQHLTVTELEAIAKRSSATFIAAMRALHPPTALTSAPSQANRQSFSATPANTAFTPSCSAWN